MTDFLRIILAVLLGAAPVSVSFSRELAKAVQTQDRARVKALVQSKVDLNAAQPDGMTALHWAVYLDDVETAKLLVKEGADIKTQNRYGITPLYLACLNGNTELVTLLLEKGADPDAKIRGGETALMTAARTGQPGPVKALLAHEPDVNAKERRGQTAIMWAAAEGHAEVVELLIKSGADYSTPLDSGFNPFFFAIREGRPEVVRTLLKAGVDVNEVMKSKRSGGRSVRGGTSGLILAVENGHYQLAIELVEAGADPNDMRSGFTPLHTLTWVRKPNRGDGESDLPPPNGSGNLSSLQFVHELVKRGADVNARLTTKRTGKAQLNTAGATPFLLAADTADLPLMRALVELGANPHLKNDDDCTALMAAAGIGTLAPGEEAGTEPECIEAVKYCLKLGLDINAVDKNGETAMHGAAYKGYPVLVEFLAQNGAKIDVWNNKNKHGWTPLLIAEGYRPGNFRPLADTIAAIHRVMLAAGVTPPPPTLKLAETPEYKDEAYKAPAP